MLSVLPPESNPKVCDGVHSVCNNVETFMEACIIKDEKTRVFIAGEDRYVTTTITIVITDAVIHQSNSASSIVNLLTFKVRQSLIFIIKSG